jgi:phosphoribosyl 1,2-cyclic phosphodiesterase
LRFASLGSGSQGNGLVVECRQTLVLLDCGFGLTETIARLSRLGVAAEELDAIIVTHEHDDHIGGVARLARRFELPVWLTWGTLASFEPLFAEIETRVIENYSPFTVGNLEMQPFPVPHDAREPAQYVFSDGQRRLGVLTDAGESTRHIERVLSQCDALVIEFNHDPDLLQQSAYPPSLKQRISSRYGHLDNAAAAGLLARLDRTRLQHLVAAHLSQQNNRPELARAAICGALGCDSHWVRIADQSEGLDWIEID